MTSVTLKIATLFETSAVNQSRGDSGAVAPAGARCGGRSSTRAATAKVCVQKIGIVGQQFVYRPGRAAWPGRERRK